MDWPVETVLLRIGAALAAGAVLGLNRWLHHKAAGIRTHALVAVGAAVAMLVVADGHDPGALSRVLQGLVAGIGFLGAGVILRDTSSQRIHGLTTAASLWIVAVLGAAFGAGEIVVGATGAVAVLAVLLFGGALERMTGRVLRRPRESEVPGED